MRSLGFEGKQEEVFETLTMCPDVSISCCTVADQITMYNKFVIGGRKEEIASQLQNNQIILNKHLSLLLVTEKIS
jgi:hypothetical protein